MDAFEFAFSLFGLLLGLALAEGLGGLARALKARHRVHIGALTALLALFLSCDLVTFWAYAWAIRAHIPPSFPVLFLGFGLTGLYYVAASLVFPEDPEEWRDLDGHFFRHRRLVLGGMFAANTVLLGVTVAVLGGTSGLFSFRSLVVSWAFFPLTATAAIARDRRVILGAMGLATLLYPVAAVWT